MIKVFTKICILFALCYNIRRNMEEITMKVIVCENYDEMSVKAFEVMKELLDAKKDAVLGFGNRI